MSDVTCVLIKGSESTISLEFIYYNSLMTVFLNVT